LDFFTIIRAKTFCFFIEDLVPGSTMSCCWPYFRPPNLAHPTSLPHYPPAATNKDTHHLCGNHSINIAHHSAMLFSLPHLQAFAWKLDLHPSTLAHLSSSYSNFPK
jgi:hypothetical protein